MLESRETNELKGSYKCCDNVEKNAKVRGRRCNWRYVKNEYGGFIEWLTICFMCI